MSKIKDGDRILGDAHGFEIVGRGKDTNCLVKLLVEDDGYWHETDVRFDSHWVDDMEKLCQEFRKRMNEGRNKRGYGKGYIAK